VFRSTRAAAAAAAAACVVGAPEVAAAPDAHGGAAAAPAIVTTERAAAPKGVLVTSGGWAYCEQARPLARKLGYTLVCGRYGLDGYTGPRLRSKRQLDWGNPEYLDALARGVRAEAARTRGPLVLVGVSYSGYGVAALAARHPELRPAALVVVDSYFDLVARRRALRDTHETAREIDAETGSSLTELRRRSVDAEELARVARSGTRLLTVWTVSEHEARLFAGATCGPAASAATLARLAAALRRPVSGWVTQTRHGVNFWRYGARIVVGRPPGQQVVFRPGASIPPAAVCRLR
jgi:pimeloyl-ACP methyl ester carboxylesterase